MLFSEDGVLFEFKYDKPACDYLGNNIHPCWRIAARNLTPPNHPCQYKWSPPDTCDPQSKSGCYKQENDVFYLRHVVNNTVQEMKKLNGGRFEVIVKRAARKFQPTVRYLLKRYEMFPMVFEIEVEKLTVNDEAISMDVTSYTILLGMYYDLEYCVYNILKGKLSVDLGGKVTMSRPHAPCVHVLFIAREALDGSEVTLSFIEKGGCQRRGQTTQFGLLVDMSTDMMVTETIEEPSPSCRPHIQWWSVLIGFILVCSL